jgi:SAM-dependent methyltransferase
LHSLQTRGAESNGQRRPQKYRREKRPGVASWSHVHYSMLRLIEGAWLAKAIHVMVALGIPDLLHRRPRGASALAAATRTHAPSLHRLLRALAHEGILSVDDLERFSLTDIGATLRSDVSGSLRDWALLMLGRVHQDAWRELLECIRTGHSAFQRRFGVDLWHYRSEHVDYATLFDAGMASFTNTYVENLLATYSFSAFRTIVDVGGGDGSLLIGILHAYPDTRGVLFDVPEAATKAKRRIDEAGLTRRCLVRAGDAFVEVPPGGDAYVLSRVIHDWDDAAAREILSKCRDVLAPDSRIVVVERVLPDRESAKSYPPLVLSDINLTDLNMMVMTSGRERTLVEYQSLFRRAGLELITVYQTRTAMSIMELRRASRRDRSHAPRRHDA